MNPPAPPQDSFETIKHLVAAGSVLSTFLGWLPHITAIVGLIWYGCQIWDWAWAKAEKRRAERAAEKERAQT